MEVSTTIDWVRYTVASGIAIDAIIPELLYAEHSKRIEPLPYYSHAMEIFPAGRVDWNRARPEQGLMVNFTGENLRSIEAQGIEKSYVVEKIVSMPECKMTRIDIAVDIVGQECSPTDVYNEWIAGHVQTRAKNCSQVRGVCKEKKRTGDTVYIGKRTGETYMRVYNKGLEKQLEDILWTRIEMELKGSKAGLGAAMVAGQGTSKTARATIERYVKFSHLEWWAGMLGSLPYADEKEMIGKNHNRSDGKHWLYTQALPAVLKAIRAGDRLLVPQVEQEINALYGGNFLTCE